MIRLPLIATLLLGTVALRAHAAPAFCPPIPPPYPISVGDTTSDANCDFDSIQAAIDSLGTCPATIAITREHLYHNQHLSIVNKSVTLMGLGDGVSCPGPTNQSVFDAVAAAPTQPVVTLDGGGSGGRVLTITGTSHVTLKYLQISHGQTAYDGSGGGIAFHGIGSLTLDTSTVDHNYAGYGGGINMEGSSSGLANLTLLAHSMVTFNNAQFSGGGVRLDNDSHLRADEPFTLIGYNTALGWDPTNNVEKYGFGGGIEATGTGAFGIGSPGYGGLGVIYGNTASYGGGVSINQTGERFIYSRNHQIYSTDAARPVRIEDNRATHAGGGIYIKPLSQGILSDWSVCLYDAEIAWNWAQNGAAIYADSDFSTFYHASWGSDVGINNAALCGNTPGIQCAPSTSCNAIHDNFSEDIYGNPTDGSIVLIQNEGSLHASHLIMQHNHGHHAIQLVGDDNIGDINQCLITDNQLDGELIYVSGDNTPLTIDGCTVANNQVQAAYLIHDESSLQISDSIIDQPTTSLTVDYSGAAALAVDHTMARDLSTLPNQPDIVASDPQFVDPANGDYHLTLGSPLLDFAPLNAADSEDLDYHARNVALPAIADVDGIRDLGAYEHAYTCAGADTLFCDSFEPLP